MQKFKDLILLVSKYFLSNVSLQLLNLVSLYLIMSTLDKRSFGAYSYVVELLSIFALIAESGTRSFYIKEISSSNNKENTIQEINTIHYLFSLISFVFICVICLFLQYNYKTLIIIGAGYAISSLFVPLQAYILATEKVKLVVMREQLIGVSRLLYFSVGYFLGLGVEYYLFFIYFQVLLVTIFWRFLNKKLSFNLFLKSRFTKDLLFKGLKIVPFTLLIAINLLYNKIDIYMLQELSSFDAVSIYAGAIKLVYPFMFLSGVFMMAVFPRLAKNKNLEDKESFQYINELTIFSMKCLSVLGFVLALILTLIGELIYRHLWSGVYISSLDVFYVLVFYLPIVFSYGVITNAMVAQNKVNILISINLFAFLLNVLLNLYFIPLYGAKGSAICTLICEVFILNFCIFFARFKLKINISNITILLNLVAQVGVLKYVISWL